MTDNELTEWEAASKDALADIKAGRLISSEFAEERILELIEEVRKHREWIRRLQVDFEGVTGDNPIGPQYGGGMIAMANHVAQRAKSYLEAIR